MSKGPRPMLLSGRLLARTAWVRRRPTQRLTNFVRDRHWPSTHPTRPRLLPLRDGPGGRGVPVRVAEEPEPVAAIPGMSDFAARWLFGDGVAEGTPFAGGAAVPAEQVGESPSFLATRGGAPAKQGPAPAKQEF